MFPGGVKALVVVCFQSCSFSISYKLARYLFGLLILDRALVPRFGLCDYFTDIVICTVTVCTGITGFLLFRVLAFKTNSLKSGCIYSAFND